MAERHNMRKTSLYSRWVGMKGRCYNPNNQKYKNYGARGVAMCDEWKDSFISFWKWATENGYQENLSLDRINVNGNYEPSNCRWTDMFTQENNRTNNRSVWYNGRVYTLTELSKISKVSYKTLHLRLFHYKWDVETAVTKPSRIKKKKGEKK